MFNLARMSHTFSQHQKFFLQCHGKRRTRCTLLGMCGNLIERSVRESYGVALAVLVMASDNTHTHTYNFSLLHSTADIEPHQGVPRLVTSSRQSRSSSLIRRGLAFMIEHGFYNTDQGRETFALNLKQITDAVHTTCYSDVLVSSPHFATPHVPMFNPHNVQPPHISTYTALAVAVQLVLQRVEHEVWSHARQAVGRNGTRAP